jgi:hypothetical protein
VEGIAVQRGDSGDIAMSVTRTAITDSHAPASRKSSNFLGRIVSSMFMRVNSRCAHQVRPPVGAGWSRAPAR